MDSSFLHTLQLIAEVFFVDLLLSGDNAVVIALASRALSATQRRQVVFAATGLAVLLRVLLTLLASVLLSVPLLMFGSWYATGLVRRYPLLVPLGAAFLGWLAGDIAVSDPLYADALMRQSPALALVVPALMAVYVVLQGRIIAARRAEAQALRPAERVKSRKLADDEVAAGTVTSLGHGSNAVSDTTVSVAEPLRVEMAQALMPEATPESEPRPVSQLASVPLPASLPEPASVPASLPILPPTEPSAESPAPSLSARRRRAPPSKALAIVAALGAVGALAMIGVSIAVSGPQWLPSPGTQTRYDCAGQGVVLLYKQGSDHLILQAGAKSATAKVRPDNQIDWGDIHEVSTRLGFVPPVRIAFVDAQGLRIDGGAFAQVSCQRR